MCVTQSESLKGKNLNITRACNSDTNIFCPDMFMISSITGNFERFYICSCWYLLDNNIHTQNVLFQHITGYYLCGHILIHGICEKKTTTKMSAYAISHCVSIFSIATTTFGTHFVIVHGIGIKNNWASQIRGDSIIFQNSVVCLFFKPYLRYLCMCKNTTAMSSNKLTI